MLADLQEQVSQVSLDIFFGTGLLPRLPNGVDVGKVLQRLKDTGVSTAKGWKPFVVTPEQKPVNENHAFAPFEQFVKTIQEAAPSDAGAATLRFECRPDTVPTSSVRYSQSKPDCYGVLSSSPVAAPEWANIAVPAEFKTDDSDNSCDDVSPRCHFSFPSHSPLCRTGPRSCGP